MNRGSWVIPVADTTKPRSSEAPIATQVTPHAPAPGRGFFCSNRGRCRGCNRSTEVPLQDHSLSRATALVGSLTLRRQSLFLVSGFEARAGYLLLISCLHLHQLPMTWLPPCNRMEFAEEKEREAQASGKTHGRKGRGRKEVSSEWGS